MKFILFLSVIILLFSSCSEEGKKVKSPEKEETVDQKKISTPSEAKNRQAEIIRIALSSEYKSVYAIRSKTDGKIESIIPEGKSVNKGDLLVQLDNSEAFERLVAGKERLITMAENVRSTLTNDTQRESWSKFESQLSPYKLLPSIPYLNSEAQQKEINDFYKEVKFLEEDMKSYFIIAEKDGIIIEQKFKAGQKVKKEAILMIAAKDKRKVIRLPKDFSYKGNAQLRNKETTKAYAISIGGDTKFFDVPSDIKNGDEYLLEFPSANQ